jgi:hypothetical protein
MGSGLLGPLQKQHGFRFGLMKQRSESRSQGISLTRQARMCLLPMGTACTVSRIAQTKVWRGAAAQPRFAQRPIVALYTPRKRCQSSSAGRITRSNSIRASGTVLT